MALFMGGPHILNLDKYCLTKQVRDHQMATGLVQLFYFIKKEGFSFKTLSIIMKWASSNPTA